MRLSLATLVLAVAIAFAAVHACSAKAAPRTWATCSVGPSWAALRSLEVSAPSKIKTTNGYRSRCTIARTVAYETAGRTGTVNVWINGRTGFNAGNWRIHRTRWDAHTNEYWVSHGRLVVDYLMRR